MSGERLTDHQNGGLEKRTWILVAVICVEYALDNLEEDDQQE